MKNRILLILITILFFLCSGNKAFCSYSFPWPQGYDWLFTQGWHCGSYDDEGHCLYNRAIDVGTDQNGYIISAEDGIITYVCTAGTSTRNVYVRHPSDNNFVFEYLHIDKNTLENNITVNATIKKGQVIGKVKVGSLAYDGCGAMTQSSNFGHTHWAFMNSSGVWGIGRTIDDWTLCSWSGSCQGGTTQFTNGLNTIDVGDNIGSLNIMKLTGNTVATTRDYVAKDMIILDSSNGSIILAPGPDQTIKIRVE